MCVSEEQRLLSPPPLSVETQAFLQNKRPCSPMNHPFNHTLMALSSPASKLHLMDFQMELDVVQRRAGWTLLLFLPSDDPCAF